jgi:hypothetical protein
MQCSQCSRTVSIWRRGLVTGICPSCQVAPGDKAAARLNRMRRIGFRIACYFVVCALLVWVIAIVYCTPLIRASISDTRFSSEEWRRGDAHMRGRMARDLVSSGQLINKSQDEVLAILGPPDIERFGGQTVRFRVDVGYRWIIRPYTYDLVVRFGKGDEVFEVAIEPQEGT